MRLPAIFCNMYVANNSSILQYCHGMSIEGVLVFYRTTEYAEGGGAYLRGESASPRCYAPLFFMKVGRKRGGRNSGAVRYIETSLVPTELIYGERFEYLVIVKGYSGTASDWDRGVADTSIYKLILYIYRGAPFRLVSNFGLLLQS